MFVAEVDPPVASIIMHGVVYVVWFCIVDSDVVGLVHQDMWNADSAKAECLICSNVGDLHLDRAVRLEILKVFHGGVGNNVHTTGLGSADT